LVQGAGTGDTYVRVMPDGSGRLRVREIYLDADEPITGALLRELPLSDVEALANGPMAELVTLGLRLPGGERLSILASHLGTQYGRDRSRLVDGQVVRGTHADRAARDWIAASWFASLGDGAREERGLAGMGVPVKRKRKRSQQIDDQYRLTAMPEGGRLDDDFMARLARAYMAAVARGEAPNVTIARDVGFPVRDERQQGVRTVQSWVYQARKRGFLPPARKGAAG
jgi:hypothetical protein